MQIYPKPPPEKPYAMLGSMYSLTHASPPKLHAIRHLLHDDRCNDGDARPAQLFLHHNAQYQEPTLLMPFSSSRKLTQRYAELSAKMQSYEAKYCIWKCGMLWKVGCQLVTIYDVDKGGNLEFAGILAFKKKKSVEMAVQTPLVQFLFFWNKFLLSEKGKLN